LLAPLFFRLNNNIIIWAWITTCKRLANALLTLSFPLSHSSLSDAASSSRGLRSRLEKHLKAAAFYAELVKDHDTGREVSLNANLGQYGLRHRRSVGAEYEKSSGGGGYDDVEDDYEQSYAAEDSYFEDGYGGEEPFFKAPRIAKVRLKVEPNI
jgi:hypothetical protein